MTPWKLLYLWFRQKWDGETVFVYTKTFLLIACILIWLSVFLRIAGM